MTVPLIVMITCVSLKTEITEIIKVYDKWFKENPFMGFITYSLSFIIYVPLLLPTSLLTAVGGFIFTRNFGSVQGFFLSWLAIFITHPLGALIAFLMSKYLIGSCIKDNVIDKIRIFQAIDQAIKK